MASKVLVVDDKPSNIKVVKQLLSLSGFDVIEAFDGYEGIEKTKAEKPFLVLMDISMPGMDGTTAMKKIREIEGFRQLPIIAFTAQAMSGDREKFLKEGFDDYVPKPLSIKLLLELVNKYFSLFEGSAIGRGASSN